MFGRPNRTADDLTALNINVAWLREDVVKFSEATAAAINALESKCLTIATRVNGLLDLRPDNPTYAAHNVPTWHTCRQSPISGRDNPTWIVLTDEASHADRITWRALINFAMTSSGTDKFLVRVEIEAPDYSGPQPKVISDVADTYVPPTTWHTIDQWDVWMATPRPDDLTTGGRMLHINGVPHSPSSMLAIEPMIGPWSARLSLAQYSGITSVVPFLIY